MSEDEHKRASWSHLLRANETVQRIAGNSGWLLLERGVSLTVRFFVSVWVVRYLGPDSYGVYSYATSFVGLFMALSTIGLDPIVVRNLARNRDEEHRVLGTAFWLRIVSGVGTMALVAFLAMALVEDTLTQVAIVLVSFQLLFQASNVCDFWFQAEVQSKYAVAVRALSVVVLAGTQVALILAEASVLAFVAILSVHTLFQALGIAAMYVYVRGSARPSWRFHRPTAIAMLRDAWPLIFAGLSISVYMKVDQVMVGEMMNTEAVGLYATAVKVSELWYILPMVLAGSVFPKVVASAEAGATKQHKQRMQVFFDVSALTAYVVIAGVLLFADELVYTLFGSTYGAAADVLKVHIGAFLFVALGIAREKWLVAENLTTFVMLSSLLGAVVNVALNAFLIPEYGIGGAAWATLVSQAGAAYLSGFASSDVRAVSWQMTRAMAVPLRLPNAIRQARDILR